MFMNSQADKGKNEKLLTGTALGMTSEDRALSIFAPDIAVDGCEILLRENTGEGSYLSPFGWSDKPYWIEPFALLRSGDWVTLGLENTVIRDIPPGTDLQYFLARNAEKVFLEGTVTWNLDGGGEPPDETTPAPEAGVTLPVPRSIREKYARHFAPTRIVEDVALEVTEPDPEPVVSDPKPKKPKRRRKLGKGLKVLKWLAASIALIGVVGGGVLAYIVYELLNIPPDVVYPKAGEAPTETLRTVISDTSYDDRQIVQIVDNWIVEGAGDAAYLLARTSAQKGNGAAALRMGLFTDPVVFDRSLSDVARPDFEIAACWYALAQTSAKLPDVPAKPEPTFIESIAARFAPKVAPPSDPFNRLDGPAHPEAAQEQLENLVDSLKASNHRATDAVEKIQNDSSSCIY